jgi:hypothetical protein
MNEDARRVTAIRRKRIIRTSYGAYRLEIDEAAGCGGARTSRGEYPSPAPLLTAVEDLRHVRVEQIDDIKYGLVEDGNKELVC